MNGDAVFDACNVCEGDNSTCTDCAGTVNGNATLDKCDVCNGDGSSCSSIFSQLTTLQLVLFLCILIVIAIVMVLFCCRSVPKSMHDGFAEAKQELLRRDELQLEQGLILKF